MIAHVITFTPGNGDLVQPGYHTSYTLAPLTVQFIAKKVPIRFVATASMWSAFLHNTLHFLGTTAYQMLLSGFNLWDRPELNWLNVRVLH